MQDTKGLRSAMQKSSIKKSPAYLKKLALSLFLANLINNIAIDLNAPAMPLMMKELQTSESLVQFALIVNFLGTLCARLGWGVFLEQFGRKKVLFPAFLFSFIGQLGCAFSPTIYWLIFFRIIQAIGGSIISVLSLAIVADLFSGRERTKVMNLVDIAFPLGMILAPILGAFLLPYIGWRGNFLILLVLQGIERFFLTKYMPETVSPDNTETLGSILKNYRNLLFNPWFFILSSISCLSISGTILLLIHSFFFYIEDWGMSPFHASILQVFSASFQLATTVILQKALNHVKIADLFYAGGLIYFIFFLGLFGFFTDLIPLNPYTLMLLTSIQGIGNILLIATSRHYAFEVQSHSNGLSSALLAAGRSLIIFLFSSISTLYFESSTQAIFGGMLIPATILIGLFAIILVRKPKWAKQAA